MSLTNSDTKYLENWFLELKMLDKSSEEYFILRDHIYTFLYEKLSDLLVIKTFEWKKKYFVLEDDTISIFHDMLLKCVTQYEPKRVKFITYFWQACENQVKNYYKKYHVQRRIPNNKLYYVDFCNINKETEIDKDFGNQTFAEILPYVHKQIKNMYDRKVDSDILNREIADNIKKLMGLLPLEEQKVLQNIVEGNSIKQIIENMNLTSLKANQYFRHIKQKARKLKW